ncbi:hypothetical protein CY34DRAFT_715811 [Suillus luteus UH-Slu-Lm8-n1]|uniref:Uncharacterized protein n=1 Tax=Suillus luteus UH-Slu-Lm8-n1 TaxID=930992 RepID=A0A0D0AGH5_9AGAM|nr:hypothetical protein CY34DRAFT_715811 [Suillus luteus UH-Slu-Lm8-n1]
MLRNITTCLGVSMNCHYNFLKPIMCVISISINWFVFRHLFDQSFPIGGAHPHSSASALIARLASLLHRFRPDHGNANELSQPPALSGSHPRSLFSRLSSLIYRSPRENHAPNELQQPSAPSRIDLHAPLAIIRRLSSIFRSQPHTNEDIELSQRPMRPRVFDVAPTRDNDVSLSLVC